MPLVVMSTMLVLGFTVERNMPATLVCFPVCVFVCFGFMNVCCHVQCKHCVLARSNVFVWEVYRDGLWDSSGRRTPYLIRMNFSNHPLLAGVEQKRGGGRGNRPGRKFDYFSAASLLLPSFVNSIYIIVSIAEPFFLNR